MTIREIARLLGGKIEGDAAHEIHDVAGLETAGPNDLTFA